jgi:hypothetical protein
MVESPAASPAASASERKRKRFKPSVSRRGYRPEIREWMGKRQLRTIPEAARRLGVGVSTLKSIMSSKGKPRYSEDTLHAVLKQIGVLKP